MDSSELELLALDYRPKQLPLDSFFGLALFTLNLTKNMIGSFILILPWAFSQSGLILGYILLFLVFIICAFTFCLMAYLGDFANKTTYSSLFSVFGKWCVVLVDFSIIMISMLANAGYLIFISFLLIPTLSIKFTTTLIKFTK